MEGAPSDALAVASGPSSSLTLFAAVHWEDVATCTATGVLPRRLQGNTAYLGFREDRVAAMARASMFSPTPVSKETHALLKVVISAEALVRLTLTMAREDYRFAPMLHKRTNRGDRDWKVWHYCGDFPLYQPGVVTVVEEIM